MIFAAQKNAILQGSEGFTPRGFTLEKARVWYPNLNYKQLTDIDEVFEGLNKAKYIKIKTEREGNKYKLKHSQNKEVYRRG